MKKFVTAVVYLMCLITLRGQSVPNQTILDGKTARNRSLYSERDHGPNLRNKVLQEGKDIDQTLSVYETAMECPSCSTVPDSNNAEVKAAARESSLIVLGKVVSKRADFTDNGAFVFTDAEFVIDEVLKSDNMGTCERQGCQITVTTPGGVARFGGHSVHIHLSNRRELQSGHKYLLFLKYVPASDSYQFATLPGFDLTTTGVVPIVSNLPAPGAKLLSDPSRFLEAVRSSIELASKGAK